MTTKVCKGGLCEENRQGLEESPVWGKASEAMLEL